MRQDFCFINTKCFVRSGVKDWTWTCDWDLIQLLRIGSYSGYQCESEVIRLSVNLARRGDQNIIEMD